MGFGLVIIGYLSVFGVLPDSFVYYNWGIYIAIIGGLIMLAGFCRLQEYNIYFKIMKYITIVYILILLGFSPFLIPKHSEQFMLMFSLVSKITRICFLFTFHFFLLTGILSLAKQIENNIVAKKAKRNIVMTYIFFSSFILQLINISEEYYILVVQFLFIFGFVYFIITLLTLYSCYMRITYEGHDEAIDAKEKAKNKKRKKKNNTWKRRI